MAKSSKGFNWGGLPFMEKVFFIVIGLLALMTPLVLLSNYQSVTSSSQAAGRGNCDDASRDRAAIHSFSLQYQQCLTNANRLYTLAYPGQVTPNCVADTLQNCTKVINRDNNPTEATRHTQSCNGYLNLCRQCLFFLDKQNAMVAQYSRDIKACNGRNSSGDNGPVEPTTVSQPTSAPRVVNPRAPKAE